MQRVHVDKATGNVHQLISCEDTIGIGLTSLPCRTCKTMIPLPTPDQIEAEGQVTFTAPSTPTPVDSAFRPARIRKNCPNCESPINMYLTVEDWRADVSQQDVPFGTWEENPEGDVMCAECGSWIDLPPKEAFPGSEPEKTLPALPRDQKPISINPLDLDIPEEIVCPHPGCKQVIHVYSKKERADAQRPRLEQIQVIAYEESGEETLCQSCGQKIPILDPNREEDFEE